MAMNSVLSRTTGALIIALTFFPLILAHGNSHDEAEMDGHRGQHHESDNPKDDTEYPPSYFSHPDHVGAIHAHIAVMTLAWVFILPVAVVLSLARSRYTLVLQFAFLVTNAVGLLVGTIYNGQTPDLYPNNSHHKLGWVVTWIVIAQVLIGTVGWVAGAVARTTNLSDNVTHAFLPVPTDAPHDSQYRILDDYRSSNPYRASDDSGQGTEPNTESLRNSSVSTLDGVDDIQLQSPQKEYGEEPDDLESVSLSSPIPKTAIGRHAARVVASRVWRYLDIATQVVDRTILPLGFVSLATGIVTFGRFFEGDEIFGGLAHWVKGGVFFWLGLFTLGRWSGSFAEVGWAWNVRPKRSGRKWWPSAEFVESALIFLYGSTNIFLEHLSGWGGEWKPRDMEHISITILFIGGGLCGMLVESTRIRDLLNTTADETEFDHPYHNDEVKQSSSPETYEFSLNPIPALVILMLGIMMSSHTQSTRTSSLVHQQWGNLLLGASFARGLTYVLLFLKPPKSVLPSRPPTELLASFGLISGGIIFMASAGDTVQGMIHYNMDAMFMYTVTMGLVGSLMAWEVIVLAIKGWAVRRERYRESHRIV